MARIRWFYFLFSLAIGGLLLTLWIRGETRGPASFLNSAVERLEAAETRIAGTQIRRHSERMAELASAHDAALREFDAAIRMARLEGEDEILQEALDRRAQLFLSRNQSQLALADSLSLLEEFGDGVETLTRVAEAALKSDQPERALDAATRLGKLDPENLEVNLLLGEANLALALRSLDESELLLAEELAPVDVQEVMRTARRAAALPPSVRGYGTYREEIRTRFRDPVAARAAIDLIDLAGEHTALALHALVRALGQRLDGIAIAGIQDILMDAGATETAAELGVAAMKLNQLPHRIHALVRTCLALEDLERFELAQSILQAQIRRKQSVATQTMGPSELLEDWCALLDRLELWDLLHTAASHLQQVRPGGTRSYALATFYLNIAAFRRAGASRSVLDSLSQITNILPDDPAIQLRAWNCYAECAHQEGDSRLERHALSKATRVRAKDLAEDADLRPMLGRAWLRRSHLEDDVGETTMAEASATHALTLLPKMRQKIFAWLSDIGKRMLVKRGSSLQALRFNLREEPLPEVKRWGPFAEAVAVRQLAQGGHFGALRSYADSLLLDYPGHPDALEGLLSLYESTDTYVGVVELALELLERGFNPKRARIALSRVPAEYLSGRNLTRWMRVDPTAAAGAVLGSMLANDRTEEALSLSNRPQLAAVDAEILARLGQRAGELGFWKESAAILGKVPAGDPVLQRFAGSLLRAGMYASILTNDEALLSDAFQRFEESFTSGESLGTEGGVPDLIRAFDSLYGADRREHAMAVLDRIEKSPDTDAGEVLLRRAVCAAIAGQEDVYRLASERADPFFDDARVLLGELLVASDARDWMEVARFAFGLLRGDFGQDPARKTYLLILAGEFESARHQLQAWGPVPDDPMGMLARALVHRLSPARTDDSEEEISFPQAQGLLTLLTANDARFLAACGLSAMTPPWSLWGLDRLRLTVREQEGQAEAWYAVLKARCLLSLGDPVLAQRMLHPWRKSERAFPAAIYLTEVIRQGLGASDEELIDLRARRLAAGGATELGELQLSRIEARQLDRVGKGAKAIEVLEEASQRHPEAHELFVDRARLLRSYSRNTEAIELYDRLFTRFPTEVKPLVPEYVLLLEESFANEEIPEAVWWAELEALEAQLPDEPVVALALAAREAGTLHHDGSTSRESTGPVRALERLQRFRKRTDETPIDGLRRGAILPWIKLHGKLDPAEALELAEDELRADPLAPHLWVALAMALDLAGERREALQILKVALSFSGSLEPRKMRTLLRFELSSDFAKLLTGIENIERFFGELQDPELRFHRGLARLATPRASARNMEAAIAETKDAIELWDRREEFGWSAERYAPRLAIALSRSGRGAKALVVLKEISESTKNPLKAQMFTALRSILKFQQQEEAERIKAATEQTSEEKAGDE